MFEAEKNQKSLIKLLIGTPDLCATPEKMYERNYKAGAANKDTHFLNNVLKFSKINLCP